MSAIEVMPISRNVKQARGPANHVVVAWIPRLLVKGAYAGESDSDDAMSIQRVERIVLAIGFALLIVWGAARLHRTLASRAAIARFQAEEAGMFAEPMSLSADPILGSKVDFSLWATNRIAAYEASLTQEKDKPLAILRIRKISLEVPVFDDTDELALNRGVGRIRGTSQIGQVGNVGIAGHRDGFFRGLKDIVPGDSIEVNFGGRTEQYVVKQIQIVNPEDIAVLSRTSTSTLTLVTCFPFYYVGSAPQRYIVTAVQDSGQRD
ncbi:MAG TPA: class D sortase [Candidatus Acidoferrum sp.]|nr:class D sortase [Candidatus Acidoferrum sp.]